MEFQSHDRIVSAELECCLTRNAGSHFAVADCSWGRWQGSLSGAPPVSQLPSIHLRHPLAPTFVFGNHVLLGPCKARPWMGWKTKASQLYCNVLLICTALIYLAECYKWDASTLSVFFFNRVVAINYFFNRLAYSWLQLYELIHPVNSMGHEGNGAEILRRDFPRTFCGPWQPPRFGIRRLVASGFWLCPWRMPQLDDWQAAFGIWWRSCVRRRGPSHKWSHAGSDG